MHRNQSRWSLLLILVATPLAEGTLGEEPAGKCSSFVLQTQECRVAPVVTGMSFQPGGARLATAGDDHVVRIWDVDHARFLLRLTGHTDWVRATAFSPDGRLLATAGDDRRIILWLSADGRRLRIVAHHKRAITKLAFSQDGRFLAAGGFESTIPVYDARSFRLIRELRGLGRDVSAMAISSDSTRLAAASSNGEVRIWSMPNGAVLHDVTADRRRVRALAFSHDGTHLVSAGDAPELRVWNVSTGTEAFTLPVATGKVFTVVVYAPNRLAAGGTDNCIHLWDLEARKQIRTLEGHKGTVAALACRPGIFASGSYDTTVRLWRFDPNVSFIGSH